MSRNIFKKLDSELKTLEQNILSNSALPSKEQILKTSQEALKERDLNNDEILILHNFLDITRQSKFLLSLNSIEERYSWADIVFDVIQISNYSLEKLFEQRIAKHPDKILFSNYIDEIRNNYSYKRVFKHIKKLATAFYDLVPGKPKVAIYSDNSLNTALTDIACLTFDIFVTPLNTHFSIETLFYIFSKLNFNIVITDSNQRLEILQQVRDKVKTDFTIVYSGKSKIIKSDKLIPFDDLLNSVNQEKIDAILNKREKFQLDEVSTVMFTSGSTEMPKGVAFSNFNLISKRFARAAALPKVGNNEVMLCYLPLFHTFGRYLEMLGSIFWGGNYVFAPKNDINSLFKFLPEIQPTGFISIPLRWKQIYEKYREILSQQSNHKLKTEIFRKLVGPKLRWGLSAAGYLEPKVFTLFNSQGVELCSGFGMTEATGGISMTLPGEYIKNSVGIPLPGVKIKFTDKSELKVNGPYIAHYLDDSDVKSQKERWLSTGDLFKQDTDEQLYIIDRIKDIYKNIQGQTIAPAFIEKKFENIPGLKRAFLIGDMKPYNTLLIVPDENESFVSKAKSQNKLNEYFGSLVSNINASLSPYERIIRYSIINRNFEESKGELTSKGTFKRKVILTNFKDEISKLYEKSRLKFDCDGIKIIIPLWILKDLGITEGDIECKINSIFNKQQKTSLTIKKISGRIQIGNFEYVVNKKEIDLGIFVRQPILWLGNPELTNFAVCKDDFDTDFSGISSQFYINRSNNKSVAVNLVTTNHFEQSLRRLSETITQALFGSDEKTIEALKLLEKLLKNAEHKIENLISRRIEALATHPKFAVRSLAYIILLINEPKIDYERYFPSFLNSGLPFLNKKVIESISYNDFEGFRFSLLLQRLKSYRKTLSWPASDQYVHQFKRILDILVKFVHHSPSYYHSVRAELVCWILHEQDARLSRYALHLFKDLAKRYEARFNLAASERNKNNWRGKIFYEDTISSKEREQIEKILTRTAFLKETFIQIFNGKKFNLSEISSNGIFISKISSSFKRYLYRISINTEHFKHYDFVLFIRPNITKQKVLETIYLMIKITHNSPGTSILPRLGSFRSDLGIVSFDFVNDLTVREKIRQLTSTRASYNKTEFDNTWEILYKRGIAGFFILLKSSDYKVLPGNISPANVVVPEPYFKAGTKILSLSGWKHYQSASDIIIPLFDNFYHQIFAHYPWTLEYLKIEWIFDACLEGLGMEDGIQFMKQLNDEIDQNTHLLLNPLLSSALEKFMERTKNTPFVNSYVISAINNYKDWIRENPDSTKNAKYDFAQNVLSIYRMEKFPEIMRYVFYSQTYFADLNEEVTKLFSRLIESLFKHPDQPATKRYELVELQDLLDDQNDKIILQKLVFPKLSPSAQMEVITDTEQPDLVIKTEIIDKFGLSYSIRKAASSFEIGSLHKLFIMDNYPIKIRNNLKYLIITDLEDEENTVGGICYKYLFPNIAHIEGIEIARNFRTRGLASNLINDYFERLKSEGIKTVTTHFYLKAFFQKFGFNIDKRYGGLVKFLEREDNL